MVWALLGCTDGRLFVPREGVQIGQEGIPPVCGPTDAEIRDPTVAPGGLEAPPDQVRDVIPSRLAGSWSLVDERAEELTLDLDVTGFGWRHTVYHPDLEPDCYVDEAYFAALAVTRTVDGEPTVEVGEILATDPSILRLTVWLAPGSPIPPSADPDDPYREALLVGELTPDAAGGEVVWRNRADGSEDVVGEWTADPAR